MATSLVLLAHQDDEIMVAPLLVSRRRDGEVFLIVYLTDGGRQAQPARRNAESLRALESLGIEASHVHFFGSELGVPDGQLYQNLARSYSHISAWLGHQVALRNIYTHAFEGGHEDHDAAAVLAIALANEQEIERVWQVPFYRAAAIGPPWFSVFSPLAENGRETTMPLTRRDAFTRLKLIRFFPSQWRSFAGLGPVIAWRSFFGTTFTMQHLTASRLWDRPMTGQLLYENRSCVSFEEFSRHATAFLAECGVSRVELSSSARHRALT